MAEQTGSNRSSWKFWLTILVSVGLLAAVAWWLREELQLERIVSREAELLRWRDEHFWLAAGLAMLIYVLVTGLSIPGATLLTLVTAWLFGFWAGLLIVSFASTAGATLALVACRWVARAGIPEAGREQLKGLRLSLDQLDERATARLLFVLRLIPLVPFFLVNLLMAALPIRVFHFWWISQLGMLPATLLYVFAGSSLPNLARLEAEGWSGLVDQRMLLALTGLGLFAGLGSWIAQRVRRSRG